MYSFEYGQHPLQLAKGAIALLVEDVVLDKIQDHPQQFIAHSN